MKATPESIETARKSTIEVFKGKEANTNGITYNQLKLKETPFPFFSK